MIVSVRRRHRRRSSAAVLDYKATGGDLNDLKDFNKIKGAFAKPADSDPAPPPPPPPPAARSLTQPDLVKFRRPGDAETS